jgi:hypothetical protein
LLILCVITNTIVLCSDGLVAEEDSYILDNLNNTFTLVFAVDMFLKIYGLGIQRYL